MCHLIDNERKFDPETINATQSCKWTITYGYEENQDLSFSINEYVHYNAIRYVNTVH